MYKNILFDFDGTVFDTAEGITKSVRYALNKRGLDAELDELRCFAGPPLVDMFAEKFGFDTDEACRATADFRERYRPTGLYECRVFPGIKELLKKLRDDGMKLAIATSKPLVHAEELLCRENMLGMFDAVCGSSADGNNSAKCDIVKRAMAALGALPEETVLIGDTKYDVAGAHICGIPCIGVRYGYAAEGELENAGADMIADSLEALYELISR